MPRSTPCAACKRFRRRCTQDCILAPYFPSNDPQRFDSVHKIFGVSNLKRMLEVVPPHQRAEAADCMSFEAASRIAEPVYGCAGIIHRLQQQMETVKGELRMIQAQLSLPPESQQRMTQNGGPSEPRNQQ